MRFKTENGSVYDLDQEKMTWKRLAITSHSDEQRFEDGNLLFWPTIEVGKVAVLEYHSTRPGFGGYVATSRVTEIWS